MVRLYCEHVDPAKMEEILGEAERRLGEFVAGGQLRR
jgi:hypothetical protein